MRYNQLLEKSEGWPVEGSHLSIPEEDLINKPALPITDIETLKKYFEDEMAEILCVVEGIDPITSGTFQALQSYGKDDIVWHKDAHFRPCLNVEGSRIEVDLDVFHEIEQESASVRSDRLPKHTNSSFRKEGSGRQRRRRMISRRKHDSFFTG